MTTKNPLFAPYKLACTVPDCGGEAVVEQSQSAGLEVGKVVPEDKSNPSFARCPKCRRYQMKVTEGPPPPEPTGLEGFSRIPQV